MQSFEKKKRVFERMHRSVSMRLSIGRNEKLCTSLRTATKTLVRGKGKLQTHAENQVESNFKLLGRRSSSSLRDFAKPWKNPNDEVFEASKANRTYNREIVNRSPIRAMISNARDNDIGGSWIINSHNF